MKPKLIAILVPIVLFLIILFQNTEVVTLKVLFWDISLSRILFIPLVALVGFVLGYLTAKVTRKKRKG